MQEVLYEQLRDLRKLLKDYAYVGVGRENGKKKGEYSPIFYKKEDWKVLKSGTFWLSPTPDKVSKGWDAALNRIATWVLLKNNKTNREILAINTHFDHVGQKARVESGKLILKKAKELAANTNLVLSGDFNVGMNSDVYQSITHNKEFPIIDTFNPKVTHKGVNYTWHDYAKIPVEQCSKIDFIFVSPDIKVISSYIPEESRKKNDFLMSDHNPIIVQLNLSAK